MLKGEEKQAKLMARAKKDARFAEVFLVALLNALEARYAATSSAEGGVLSKKVP